MEGMEAATAPPDGGWGWMVVLGAALINTVNQAMFSLFGLVFGEELKRMAGGKATGITLVMAISVMTTNFSGLVVGPMMSRFSVRTITIFGILCVGSGMIISSYATEIWHIIIGYGFFTGLGLGLLASVTFLAINDYFTKRKSTAVGLSMAGTSVGQMVMPILVGILIKNYNYSGTTFILGFINYSGLIGALFFKPIFCCKSRPSKTIPSMEIDFKIQPKTKDDLCDVNFNDGQSKALTNGKDESKILLNPQSLEERKLKKNGMIKSGIKQHYKDSAVEMTTSTEFCKKNPPVKEGILTRIVHSLDLSLLKDFTFVHLLIGLSLGYVSTISFSTFFPMFLQDEVEFNLMQTTFCMTALSFADIIGRVTVAEICRMLNFNNKTSFMVGCILLAAARSFMMEATEYKYVFAASFVVGYCRAITVINQNLVISEYISKDKLPSAVGLNMVSKGLFVLTLGQSLGLMKDAFSYRICIHILNVILIFVVVSWTLERIIRGKKIIVGG